MNQISEIATAAPATSRPVPRRDYYGALSRSGLPAPVCALLEEVKKEAGITEGVTSTNSRGGYDALNVDVYGYDAARNLIAIQIRHTWRKRDGDWTRQEKFYALAGIDDGQVFCHVVSTSFRRIVDIDDKSPEDVVRWAESKIFRVPLSRIDTIIRQGDIALVPVRSIPRSAEALGDRKIVLRGSHVVEVDGTFYRDDETGRTWADGLVQIGHDPGQHRPIDADGRHEIVVGQRLSVDFNTID